MCVVSMIGDHFGDKFKQWPWGKTSGTVSYGVWDESRVSKEDFDELKKEVEECKRLLIRAAKYDKENNEPHCENSEKILLLQKVADLFGIDLKF